MSQAQALEQLLEPVTLARVLDGFKTTVRNSFVTDWRRAVNPYATTPNPTRAETKRRVNICYRWFMVLRADMHYSVPHALDTLPIALRAELDGTKWEPPSVDRSWSPQAG